ncbi:phytanoyl-CoA dioxygenase [Phlebopus sp. FC_14]|nr:phytanoyl-CoA dioxygenase [Phlebopus sp. FC_14]
MSARIWLKWSEGVQPPFTCRGFKRREESQRSQNKENRRTSFTRVVFKSYHQHIPMVFNTNFPLLEEYPLSQSVIDEYQENGHVLLRNVIPASEIPEFRNVVLRSHDALLTDEDRRPAMTTYDKAFRLTENLWEINDLVRAHVLSKRYAGIAAKLLGCRDVRIYHDLTFFKEGRGKGSVTPWHQDGHYWPLATEKCITLWVPLIDCPVEMGPMSFVSGSHKSRAAEHLEISDESDAFIRKLVDEHGLSVAPAQHMNAGDATFHSCWTYHAAGANTTDTTREAFAIAYFDADATIPTDPPVNKRRAANLAKWFPGGEPGKVAATEKNPAVLALATDF